MPPSYVATIEPVSTCPVNCLMCPVSRRDVVQPKGRLMTLEIAEATARRLRADFDVGYAAFGNWGEPLLHPEIADLIRAFRAAGIESLYLTSSLSARFDADALAQSGLGYLDISISGTTADVYHRGHARGDWELILENMRAVAQARDVHAPDMGIGLRWHRYRYNEHQYADAREFAERMGFQFKPYFGHFGSIEAMHDYDAGTLPESRRRFVDEHVFLDFVRASIREHAGETSCPQAENLIVHADGRLLHCCAVMGSHESGIDFLGLPREELLAFKRAPNPLCGECLAKGWSGFMHGSKVDEAASDDPAAITAP